MKLAQFSSLLALLLVAGCHSVGDPTASSRTTPTYNVRDFGAAGDGVAKDTLAFQKALDTCAVNGGGQVNVPAGRYLIGSVQIGNRTTLHLQQDSVLVGSADPEDYPMVDVRWEGRWQPGRRALIYADNVNDIGIIGPGRIEGNHAVAAPQNPRGALVIEPVNCNGVYWEGFSISQGGNWAIHPTYCTDVLIRNITIRGDRDGIDIDSCRNVRVEGCDIVTGDDCISLKSGRGMDGARIGKPTENVLITDCKLVGGHFAAIGIGSETSGGVRDVRIENCELSGRTHAIYIKTRIGRAGVTESITGNNLTVSRGGFLRINLIRGGNTNTTDDPVEGLIGYPSARNLRFSNIRLNDAAMLVKATETTPLKPVEGLSIQNVSGTCKQGMILANIHDLNLRNIDISGYEGPLLTHTNVHGKIRVP